MASRTACSREGSVDTEAEPISTLSTLAASNEASAFSTRRTHAWQCIPSIEIFMPSIYTMPERPEGRELPARRRFPKKAKSEEGAPAKKSLAHRWRSPKRISGGSPLARGREVDRDGFLASIIRGFHDRYIASRLHFGIDVVQRVRLGQVELARHAINLNID